MTSIDIPSGTASLRDASARSAIALPGWGAVAFGALFVVAGAGVIAGVTLGSAASVHGPRWVAIAAGAIFLCAGLWVSGNGVADVLRKREAARAAALSPATPWTWDYHRRADGIASQSTREITAAFGITLFVALFALPFQWIGFVAKDASRAFTVGAVLMDFAVVGLLARAVRLVLMRRRYGRSWLRFAHFPFRAGERVGLSLDSFGQLSLLPSLTATLRCVQERYETRGSGRERTTEVVCYALWSSTTTVEKNRKGFFELAFDLPATVPATSLSERPARYWELLLASGDVPGVDYAARFLVPVY